MSNTRVLSVGVAVWFLLGVLGAAFPPPARAAWVNADATVFDVGKAFQFGTPPNTTPTIVPTAVGTAFADPTCGVGGTSLAVVQGLKLAGVDPSLYPTALVVSCLDPANRARLNFINPVDQTSFVGGTPAGTVIQQLSTSVAPPSGWAHLINRQDKGDLLGCGGDGSLYSIDYSQTTTNPDGTATALTLTPGVTSCTALTWDAEADVIYIATTTNGIVRYSNPDPATTPPLPGSFLGSLASPCATNTNTNGLAISGGVLLVSCQGALTIERRDKSTGDDLEVFPTLTATGLTPLDLDPGLGAFACDPATFHKDATGRDLFTDALWSRRGTNGNGVVALEFPAYTCGMPSNSVVLQNGKRYSPLAPGFAVPGPKGRGEVPRPKDPAPGACFDAAGNVKDADGDGLPDCWETSGIDFDGDSTTDLQLCVQVNTNGDGVTLVQECAVPNHKDLFVEIDYMQDHKPDPLALSQTQSPATLVKGNPVGVKSVREAFLAAPVTSTDPAVRTGIRLHMQVDEQVVFQPLSGPPTSHVNQVAFTPCTGPAANALDPAEAVDFDTIKAANFGTAAERNIADLIQRANTLNAKRLAFRYVVFAHNVVGTPGGGSNGSGCSETGGDDGVVTLGSFVQTTVNGVSHRRGTTDQQAGTFMHEFGHLLGFGHGGPDHINCKPNYRSVMSYTRQFAGSPIPNRRLDYSRSLDPLILNPDGTIDLTKTGVLDESTLNEGSALGTHASRGPISPYFPQKDTIVFGPGAWSIASADATSINWNRTGTTPESGVSADINRGPTNTSCDGAGGNPLVVGGNPLEGQDDWSNVLYRPSAAINFAGGESPVEMTSDDELAFFEALDRDGNGVGDKSDCGGAVANGTPAFPCTHRLALPDGIAPPANFRIVIFSETTGNNVWNAPTQVIPNGKNGSAICPPLHLPANGTTDCTLTISVGDVVIPVKTPADGTCSAQHMPDPTTGQIDGIKDMVCQVKTSDQPLLPHGTVFVIVSGFFVDNITNETRAFSARREVTIP
jgi:hypothetical protein